jgi:gamma-aminobutyric acid type B receptor
MMSCSIIPTTLQEPVSVRMLDVACMLDIYLFSLGFSTTFAALFSKTWRINMVLANAKKFRRVTIRARDVLLPFTILTVLNMIILITWTIVAPLRWEREVVEEDMFGQPIASRGTCLLSVSSSKSAETTFMCLLCAVNVTALLFSNYQSYRARKLPSEFNETLYLAMTNLVILEGMVLGAPILFVVGDDPTSFMLIRSLLVSIICLAVLVPMFVPKFNWAKDEKAKRHVTNAAADYGNVAQPSSSGGNLGNVPTATTYGVTTGGVESITS